MWGQRPFTSNLGRRFRPGSGLQNVFHAPEALAPCKGVTSNYSWSRPRPPPSRDLLGPPPSHHRFASRTGCGRRKMAHATFELMQGVPCTVVRQDQPSKEDGRFRARLVLRCGVGRSTASIPVDQRGGSLLPVGRQNAPDVAFADPQYLGCLANRQLADQHAVQYLQSRLFLLAQCHSLHGMTISLNS